MDLDFSKIKTLFLDLDGTLINSLPRLKYVYDDFLNEHNLMGSHEEFSHLKTATIDKLIEHFTGKYPLALTPLALKKKYEQYLEKHYFSAPLFHGVRTFLKKAKLSGLELYLTTANHKLSAEKILSKHKVLNLFSKIYTPACFKHTLKDASFYQKALLETKYSPSEVLVIDDSIEVIASTSQLGFKTFLFSKINYHPLPCFGSWRSLSREWFQHVPA